uniref:Uncharacterized protein n=1 Tax=Ditylum brightwellii TaxID=49249 RepID=A0A7S1Z2V5_9STRA
MASKYKFFIVLIVLLSVKSIDHLRKSSLRNAASEDIIKEINNLEVEIGDIDSVNIATERGDEIFNPIANDESVADPVLEEVDVEIIQEINDAESAIEAEMEESIEDVMYSNMGDISTTEMDTVILDSHDDPEKNNIGENTDKIVGNFDSVAYSDEEAEEESSTNSIQFKDAEEDMEDTTQSQTVNSPAEPIIDYPGLRSGLVSLPQEGSLRDIEYSHYRHQNKKDPYTKLLLEQSRALPDIRRPDGKKVRYLSLGCTSPKQGRKLSWEDSYTNLLSTDTNLVVRAGCGMTGPLYPSVCTESLISEVAHSRSQEFDVIILNFFSKGLNGLYDLAVRLRERYPDAIMVVLRVVQMNHINWAQNGKIIGTLEDLAKWRKYKFGSEELFSFIKHNKQLTLRWMGFAERDKVLLKIKKKLGAKIRGIPMSLDPKETILKYHEYFSQDFRGLSIRGHVLLLKAIRQATKTGMETYPMEPRIGTWGDGDKCSSWYTSGVITENHSPSLVMEQFTFSSSRKLFALSTGLDHPHAGSWIHVTNPYNQDRQLFISYMASGPDYSIYPQTEITLQFTNQKGERIERKFTTNPLSSTAYSHLGRVNTVKTKDLGVIPPGTSVVSWVPLERKNRPFRITAMKVVKEGVSSVGVLGPAVDLRVDHY